MQRIDKNNLTKLITIQSHIRRAQIRDKYVINQLKDKALENYDTFVVGNDPKMPKTLEKYAEPKDKIALVATSGMRAVSLACKLGNPTQLPKIILVDNSKQVTSFWQAMRHFMQDDAKTGTEALFLKNLSSFLHNNRSLYREIEASAYKDDCNDKIKYLSQDIDGYFKTLFDKYSYDYVKKIILHTSVIKQSWADADTFKKIKNITSYLEINKIFMYPSNIVACIDDKKTQKKVLKNIESMSPLLSIHTDVCHKHGYPEKVFLITNQKPSAVKSLLFHSTCLKSSHTTASTNQKLSLDELILFLAILEAKKPTSDHQPLFKIKV